VHISDEALAKVPQRRVAVMDGFLARDELPNSSQAIERERLKPANAGRTPTPFSSIPPSRRSRC
jgi:hypothetical protein